MKVVITAQGNTPDSEVDPRFGRAERFLIVDVETGEFEVLDNSASLPPSDVETTRNTAPLLPIIAS